MGNIHRDANNAVAAAFREGEMRMVDGGPSNKRSAGDAAVDT